MSRLWGREPALILGAIQAILALVVSFGLDLSVEQTGAILAASAAVLAVITRSQVSPAAEPNLPHLGAYEPDEDEEG